MHNITCDDIVIVCILSHSQSKSFDYGKWWTNSSTERVSYDNMYRLCRS